MKSCKKGVVKKPIKACCPIIVNKQIITEVNGKCGPRGPVGPCGPRGPVGPYGPAGARGLQSLRGLTGATGATGAPRVSAGAPIIPFASGVPLSLTSALGDEAATVGLVGFGNALSGIELDATGDIVLDPLTGLSGSNFAFTMPRDGVITSTTAFFNVTAAIALAGSATITAQLFISDSPSSNTFSPIGGTAVTLTTITTPVAVGAGTATGASLPLSIAVAAQSRLLMVFSVSTTGVLGTGVVAGVGSAGLTII